jgi:hypothetical protein
MRPADQWSCDDVEAARIEANVQARPLGRNGPTPIQLWESRTAIASTERIRFVDCLQEACVEETQKLLDQRHGSQPNPAPLSLNMPERATVARRAIRRVLVELGYLFVRRIAI